MATMIAILKATPAIFYAENSLCGIQQMQDIVLLYEKNIIKTINPTIGYTLEDYKNEVSEEWQNIELSEIISLTLTSEDYLTFWNSDTHKTLFIKFYQIFPEHGQVLSKMFDKLSNHYSKHFKFVGGVFDISEEREKSDYVLPDDNVVFNDIVLKEVPEYFGITMSDFIEKQYISF